MKHENLYSTTLIKIPVPRFVIFYNGIAPQPEQRILRLSDAFEKEQKEPQLELAVQFYNINLGHNSELLETCQLLKEYAQYVHQVRLYAKSLPFREAVENAVDYCIENSILADFLLKNRAEAIEMSIFEYDEEKHMKSERKEWREIGREEGRAELLIQNVESTMKYFGIELQQACEGLGISIDEYENAKSKPVREVY